MTTATYTYGNDPATSTKDQVRYLIHDTGPYPPNASDTDPTGWESSDQEINWLYSEWNNPYFAAAAVCSNLSAKYTKMANRKRVGPTDIEQASQQSKAQDFSVLAEQLRQQGQTIGTSVNAFYAGGISVAQKNATYNSRTLVKPAVRSGEFDYGGVADGFDDYDNNPVFNGQGGNGNQ